MHATGERAWAVGEAGTIIAYDGQAWSQVRNGGPDLHAIAAAGDRLWVVGDDGTILSADVAAGSTWSTVASDTTADLRGVWAIAPDDVWAVGNAVILHYDGAAWSVHTPDTATGAELEAVWGRAHDDVWAVGAGFDGHVLHWDGATWNGIGVDGPSTQLDSAGSGARARQRARS